MYDKKLTAEEIKKEVNRLANEAAGEWCPNGGWQFPFDFGEGIIAPTYTPIQFMHLWRRKVLLESIDNLVPKEVRASLPVLDLGGGEGAMSIGLWSLGFRDITMVEMRQLNIEKARFAANHFQADINFHLSTIDDFFHNNIKQYEITIFMGILYHILNPFDVMKRIGECTSKYMVLETALSLPKIRGFKNRKDYRPTNAAFYIRIDSAESHTAGIHDFELWPNIEAVELLIRYGGFNSLQKLTAKKAPPDFSNNSRVIVLAEK
jgi:hypothetical protein